MPSPHTAPPPLLVDDPDDEEEPLPDVTLELPPWPPAGDGSPNSPTTLQAPMPREARRMDAAVIARVRVCMRAWYAGEAAHQQRWNASRP